MDVFEAIATTRAMRRLDPDRDVPVEHIRKILDAARRAPSGTNSQPVRWLVVKDAEKRKQLGEIYRECWTPVSRMYSSRQVDDDLGRVLRSADHLGEHMGDAPVIIIPCSGGQVGQVESSVFPAVQNLFLAARALGLGTTLTTVHRMQEAKVREVLGIPEDIVTWAMIPVGYPTGKWGEGKRKPVEEVTYWDQWGSAPPF